MNDGEKRARYVSRKIWRDIHEQNLKEERTTFFRIGMLVGVVLFGVVIGITVLIATEPLCFG